MNAAEKTPPIPDEIRIARTQLEHPMFGSTAQIEAKKTLAKWRLQACYECRGRGDRGNPPTTCADCNGSGKRWVKHHKPRELAAGKKPPGAAW